MNYMFNFHTTGRRVNYSLPLECATNTAPAHGQCMLGRNRAILSLGANQRSWWGEPSATLKRTLVELEDAGVRPIKVSHIYDTPPVGVSRQARFVNMVILASVSVPPVQLLRICKRIEGRAGRTRGTLGGPRALDIDIVDFSGWTLGWCAASNTARTNRQRGRLSLPHPEAHRRLFVLVPLLDVLPHWTHPVLRRSLKSMLISRGGIRAVDSDDLSCNSRVIDAHRRT